MPTRPNVVFIFTDQHRADMLGCAGSKYVNAPQLDRLAASGTRMTQAYCTTPLCVPSRTSYFTGNYAARNGSYSNERFLPNGGAHLATDLKAADYRLALCGKNHAFEDAELADWNHTELYAMHGKAPKPFCRPMTEADRAIAQWRRAAIPYFEAPIHTAQPGSATDDPAIRQTDDALRFIESQSDADAPFFLWLSFEAPHFPYVLPEPYYSRAVAGAPIMPGTIDTELWQSDSSLRLTLQHAGLRMDEMSEADIRHVQALYCGMIEMVDEQVGRVLDSLESRGLDQNIIVVFASDHGDYWGHRGLIGKSNALHEDLLRIPTIWRVPGGIKSPTLSDALIENTDFAPTLLDLLGIEATHPMQGRSYANVLCGQATAHRQQIVAESSLGLPRTAPAAIRQSIAKRDSLTEMEGTFWFVRRLGGMTRSLLRPPYKLITHADGRELYKLDEDPNEANDLSNEPAHADPLGSLEAELRAVDLAHRS